MRFFQLCFFCVFLSSQPLVAGNSWSGSMHQLSGVLQEILEDVHTGKKAAEKKSLKRLEKNTKKLLSLSHSIKKLQKKALGGPIDKDPSIGVLSEIFEDEVKQAYSAMKKGHVDYAKAVLASVSTYCISCHTRNDLGPKYPAMTLKLNTQGLSPLEKADLLTATRQFKRATQEYEKIILDKRQMEKNPFDWQRAINKMLLLRIRVEPNPKAALSVLEKVSLSPRSALFLNARLDSWLSSLREWQKEKKKKKKKRINLKEIKNLMDRGKKKQAYPLDPSGNVYYLRASAALHRLLGTSLNNKQTAEAFYLTGLVYEVVDVLKVWSLPEVYYQSCIKKLPHSSMAERCYRRFEENVYLGYTGSAGTNLPEDVKWKLRSLRIQASVKKRKKP